MWASRLRSAAALAASLGFAALLLPQPAAAHALIGKQDLPIPVWLFIWAAAVVLIVSFVVLSIAWREPRLQSENRRPAPPALSALVAGPVTGALAGMAGVALLVAVLYAGFDGTEAPDRNFSLTFVFVTFFLGGVLLSVLFGDVMRAFNPWRAIGRVFGGVVGLVSGQKSAAPFPYPERLGHWPATAGLLAFGWLELIYGVGNVGLAPETVAVATMIYTALTLTGMALFGVDAWIERGETFSVYFNMFSRLSSFVVEDRRLMFRRPLTGAPGWGEVPGLRLLRAHLHRDHVVRRCAGGHAGGPDQDRLRRVARPRPQRRALLPHHRLDLPGPGPGRGLRPLLPRHPRDARRPRRSLHRAARPSSSPTR